MTSIRTVASLILAITILQAALGLLSVDLPLTMTALAFPTTAIGFVAAAYSAGFIAGAYLGPPMLARIGHIRAFALSAALACATTLALHWADGAAPWMITRFSTGAAMAVLFAAGESWMSGAVSRAERGNVIGFYMVCSKAALAIGPFLAAGAAPGAPEPLMIAAMLLAMAMVPVCFTSQQQPAPPKAHVLSLKALYSTAPAAVIACFAAGLTNSGVMTLTPIYAEQRFGEGSAAGFQSAAWIGSLILQWPAGKLSDLIDRRIVVAALVALQALASLALALTAPFTGLAAASLIFALWGAAGLSYYGVAVAHMADRAEPGQMAGATAGLLFCWGLGAVTGPALMGVLADMFGPQVVFWFAAGAGGVLAGAMVVRRASREKVEEGQKAPFSNKPATSVAAAELAYGDEETASARQDAQ